MSPYEIRQSRDGSINYDHYYARPVSLLSLPMRRFLRGGSAALIAAGTIAVLVSAILVNA